MYEKFVKSISACHNVRKNIDFRVWQLSNNTELNRSMQISQIRKTNCKPCIQLTMNMMSVNQRIILKQQQQQQKNNIMIEQITTNNVNIYFTTIKYLVELIYRLFQTIMVLITR